MSAFNGSKQKIWGLLLLSIIMVDIGFKECAVPTATFLDLVFDRLVEGGGSNGGGGLRKEWGALRSRTVRHK